MHEIPMPETYASFQDAHPWKILLVEKPHHRIQDPHIPRRFAEQAPQGFLLTSTEHAHLDCRSIRVTRKAIQASHKKTEEPSGPVDHLEKHRIRRMGSFCRFGGIHDTIRAILSINIDEQKPRFDPLILMDPPEQQNSQDSSP